MASGFLYSLLLNTALLTVRTSAAIPSGESFTSMYYDCCKPACAWPTQGRFISGLKTCNVNDQYVLDDTAGNYCGGGPASSCIEQTPWAVNDSFSYGCYALEFLDSDIKGKKMIVQGINVNYNEDQINWFSLTVPGQADWQGMCEKRFGGTFGEFFGVNATGLTNVTQCDNVPQPLQAACEWRYTWYKNVKGPNATFARVECPAELTKVSGCLRVDDKTFDPSTAKNTAALAVTSSPLVVFAAVILLFVGLPAWLDFF
ncbi:Endoglucanase-5 [Drechslerella dactyloides]|uniref:cellulase n=1 Tax=Drechslerella dactyloides TaxID=74499 RepID=A0AAD6NHE6_DREDA|nr:Endoglucanase-5 [Drechslerella dactyloides]